MSHLPYEMERFGLKQGQRINWAIYGAIARADPERCTQQIAYEKFLKEEGLVEEKKGVVS